MKKRLLSLILSIAMICTLFPVSAFAEETQSESKEYEIDEMISIGSSLEGWEFLEYNDRWNIGDAVFFGKIEGGKTTVYSKDKDSGKKTVYYAFEKLIKSFFVDADKLYYLFDGNIYCLDILHETETQIYGDGDISDFCCNNSREICAYRDEGDTPISIPLQEKRILKSSQNVSANLKTTVTAEYALFPSTVLKITQGANGTYSHVNQNAIDIAGSTSYFAAFSGTIVAIKPEYNAVVLQSDNEVIYANGDRGYLSVLYMHDNDISDIEIGNHYDQGEYFYQQGIKEPAGQHNVKGAHVHLCVRTGKDKYLNSYGSGNIYAYDALWLQPTTEILNDYGYNWRVLSPCNHNYVNDRCTKCGQFLPNQDNNVSVETGTYEVSAAKAYFRENPYASSKEGVPSLLYPGSEQLLATLSKGTQVSVVGAVKNYYGNLWYKVSYGGKTGYIIAENLTLVQKDVGIVTIASGSLPIPTNGTHKKGDYFTVAGTIKSTNCNLVKAAAWIENSSGTKVCTVSEYTFSGSPKNEFVLKGSKLDTGLTFNTLAIGRYRYAVYFTTDKALSDGSKSITFYSGYFDVVDPSAPTTTYTIIYNANGGSMDGTWATMSDSWTDASSSHTFTVTSTVPTRNGYQFLGWATSSSATSPSYSGGSSITLSSSSPTKTLYAVWTVNTCTITYDANGGSGAPSAQTVSCGSQVTLSSSYPSRAGYTFAGWSTSSTATLATYPPGFSFTINNSMYLYAVWTVNTYTITYNANGGNGAPSSQTKTHGVALTLSSTTPTATGYTFLGWSTSSTATTATYAAGGSYTANASVTLYAVWKANTPGKPTAVWLDSNVIPDCGALEVYWTASDNTDYYEVHISNSAGRVQNNWGTTDLHATFTGLEPGDYWVSVVAINADLVGKGIYYTESDLCTFRVENSLTYTPVKSFAFNGSEYYVFDNTLTAKDAQAFCESRGGHLATISNADENAAVSSVLQNGNSLVYWLGATDAETEGTWKWMTGEAFTYSNWASGEPNNEEYYCADGEDYLGVYSGDGLQGLWVDLSNAQRCGFVMEIESITITYNANGGSGAPSSQTKTHGSALTLSSTIPTRTGYTFLGWSTSSTATTATYAAGDSYTGDTSVTLYAVWSESVNYCGGEGDGTNLTWKLDSTGTLTISGKGKMADSYFNSIVAPVPLFEECDKIKTVLIEEGVTSIGESAFFDCTNLTSITIPDGVTSIGKTAFFYCESLTSITIPDGVTSIGERVFSYCTGLTSVTIPENIISIEEAAFFCCTNLTSVTIPASVTSIGKTAFTGCEGLTSITIPKSVTSIKEGAFLGCNDLTDVYFGGSEAQWNALKQNIGVDNDSLFIATIHFAETHTHSYNQQVTTEQNLASPATCTDAAKYYYSCECGEKGTDTFASGSPLGHNYVNGECSRCHEHDPEYHSVDSEIELGTATGIAGKTVSIPVVLVNNPGVATIGFEVSYDTSAFRLTGITNGEIFAESEIDGNIGRVPFMFSAFNGKADKTNSGKLAVLEFEVLSNAPIGEYVIGISGVEATNIAEQLVPFTATDGKITVTNVIAGDVNGDGSVTRLDLTRLAKYFSGYDVEIDSAAADTNGDGPVTRLDLTRLAKYFSGYDVKLGEK